MTILRRLLSSQDIDALLGDIAEEARHRSRLWYCGQIVAILLVGSWCDVRRHPWLALRAIVVGGVSLVAYFYALRASLQGFTYLNSGFFIGSLRIQWSPRWDSERLAIEAFFVAILCLSLFGGAMSGWIVGRLHRAQGITMVICFAAFVALLVAIGTIRGALLTSAWTAFAIIRTALNGAMLTVVPVTILAGGVWSTRSGGANGGVLGRKPTTQLDDDPRRPVPNRRDS